MRLLLSALVGLFVVVAFVIFFFMSSLLAFVESPERLIASAQDHKVRQDIVRITAKYIADEVAADDTLKPMSVEELESIIGAVISEQWMHASLRGAHSALRTAFHGAEDSAVLDFRETKLALRTALEALKLQAGQSCYELWGPELCLDQQASRILVASFEIRALAAIDQIADEIDLLQGVGEVDRERVTEVKQALESIETMRMLALALLIMSLAIFIALGSRPLRLLILRTGLLALVASGLYLLVVAVCEGLVRDTLTQGAHKMSASPAASAQVEELTVELMHQVIGSAMRGSTMPVACIGVVALVSVSLTLLLGRHKR